MLWSAALSGLLELTNGCILLNSVPEESTRFLLCTAFLSFGGVCVLMQTVSVVKELGIRFYLMGKIFQCVISVLIAYMIQPFLFPNETDQLLRFPHAGMLFFLFFLLFITLSRKKV